MKLKSILILIITTCILWSCNQNKFIEGERITTDVYITKVFKAKYSKVIGYIYYNNIKLEVDNGNSGYYYKDYNIYVGQKIRRTVIVCKYRYYTNSPYTDDIILSTEDIDFSDFVNN